MSARRSSRPFGSQLCARVRWMSWGRMPVRLCAWLVVAAGAMLPGGLQAQSLLLTLDEAVRRGLEESPAAEIARQGYEAAVWGDRATRAGFRPALVLSGSGPGLFRSISDIQQDDGSLRYIPQSRWQSQLNLAVEQDVPLTGGTVFLSSGVSRLDILGGPNFQQWQATPVTIGVEQPLFSFNQMRWTRRLQPIEFRLAQRTYLEERADIAVETANLFFAVYFAERRVAAAAFNVAVNDTIYTVAQGRYELGKIAENELLQTELQHLNAQTALTEARIDYDRAVQDLKVALGIPYETDVEVVPPMEVPLIEVDPVRAVAEARDRRAAFTNFELQEEMAERAVAQAKFSNGFQATIQASFGLNQSSTAFRDLYLEPLNEQRLSVNVRMPLFQWGRGTALLEEARSNAEQTTREIRLQREELEQAIYFEVLGFNQQRQQVEIAAKANEIAERRFEVARGRYEIGKIDITDLFDAQQAKDSAREAYIRQLQNYWVSYFQLRRLTLYDFATDAPLRLE